MSAHLHPVAGLTRREFLQEVVCLGSAAVGLTVLGCASTAPTTKQGPVRAYRVGLLAPSSGDMPPSRPEFWDRLAELGYVEGENLTKEVRGVDASDATNFDAQFEALASELVRLQVDVIVVTNRSIRGALAATNTVPIVLMTTSISDPVAEGLVERLNRPGKNVTGTMGPPPEVDMKRLELLVEAVPGIQRVAVLGFSGDLSEGHWVSVARSLGVELIGLPDGDYGLETALDEIREMHADALLTRPGLGSTVNSQLIASFAQRARLPGIYPTRNYALGGGLIAYEPRAAAMYRRAADYVDRILRGAQPSELPLEQPMHYDLIVNLSAARELGLSLPQAFLVQANEVIE